MQSLETQPLLLDVQSITLRVTSEDFEKLCQDNPDRSFELTASGELIIMTPVGGESGNSELELGTDLAIWNRQTKLGKIFSSSTMFVLPNGAQRSPDAAWVELSRWETLTPEQRKKFLPLAPDFVIELRSETDSPEERLRQRLLPLREKMEEYRSNGVQLGLLIDPNNKQVEIYRLGQESEMIESPISIDCGDVMPGFMLNMSEIW